VALHTMHMARGLPPGMRRKQHYIAQLDAFFAAFQPR